MWAQILITKGECEVIRTRFRTIHIPRGDTGFISLPNLVPYEQDGSIAILFVFDKEQRKTVLTKQTSAEDENLLFNFVPEDTVDLEEKTYLWDVKIYKRPVYNDEGELSGADQIDSVYAAFELPEFIVEQTPSTGLGGA